MPDQPRQELLSNVEAGDPETLDRLRPIVEASLRADASAGDPTAARLLYAQGKRINPDLCQFDAPPQSPQPPNHALAYARRFGVALPDVIPDARPLVRVFAAILAVAAVFAVIGLVAKVALNGRRSLAPIIPAAALSAGLLMRLSLSGRWRSPRWPSLIAQLAIDMLIGLLVPAMLILFLGLLAAAMAWLAQ